MNRKTYMRDVYSKYWITARDKIYGFLEYDKNLCQYICGHIRDGGKLLDVACGTGYPFADFFQKAGYLVYGIDISPDLIQKCRQLNSRVNSEVGSAEDMDYLDDYFDCTYCFHSTWYFSNLNKVIDEMLRVTRPGGLIMFDIQNRNNKSIDSIYRRIVLRNRRIIRYPLNVARVILRRGVAVWHWTLDVHQVPTYPESIYQHLEKRRISGFQVMVKKEDESIETMSNLGSFRDFGRLVFVVRK